MSVICYSPLPPPQISSFILQNTVDYNWVVGNAAKKMIIMVNIVRTKCIRLRLSISHFHLTFLNSIQHRIARPLMKIGMLLFAKQDKRKNGSIKMTKARQNYNKFSLDGRSSTLYNPREQKNTASIKDASTSHQSKMHSTNGSFGTLVSLLHLILFM